MPNLFFVLNPFAHIMGPSHAPHAPTLRRTFLEKIKSSWDLFFGKSLCQDSMSFESTSFSQARLGLIDYLTLGLRHLSEYGWIYAFFKATDENTHILIRCLAGMLVPFNLFVYLAVSTVNAVVSGVMTLISTMLVTPFVHLVSSFLVKNKLEAIMNCEEQISLRPADTLFSTKGSHIQGSGQSESLAKLLAYPKELDGISLDNCVVVTRSPEPPRAYLTLARKEDVCRNECINYGIYGKMMNFNDSAETRKLLTLFAPGQTRETELCHRKKNQNR